MNIKYIVAFILGWCVAGFLWWLAGNNIPLERGHDIIEFILLSFMGGLLGCIVAECKSDIN